MPVLGSLCLQLNKYSYLRLVGTIFVSSLERIYYALGITIKLLRLSSDCYRRLMTALLCTNKSDIIRIDRLNAIFSHFACYLRSVVGTMIKYV